MRYVPIDPGFFTDNRKQFSARMDQGSIAIFHSNDEFPRNGDQNFPFRQQSDLFYLSGIDQEETILMLAPGHPNMAFREMLFVKETSEQIAIWEGQKLSKEEASKASGVKSVSWTKDFDFVLKDLMMWAGKVYLNSNEYPKYFNPVPTKDLRFAKELSERFPTHDFDRSAPLMTALRKIKSEAEIGLIRKAGEITGKAFERICKYVKAGVREFEIQAQIEYVFTMNAANGNAYKPSWSWPKKYRKSLSWRK